MRRRVEIRARRCLQRRGERRPVFEQPTTEQQAREGDDADSSVEEQHEV